MRMGELSRRTGVSIPTIKFYLREGLLKAGQRTSPNQAQYGDEHVRRLNLVRALVDVGGLSIAGARAVLAQLDSTDADSLESLGKVQYSLLPRREPEIDTDDAARESGRIVGDLLERRGLRVRPDNPALASLTEVVGVLVRLGQQDVLGLLDHYADAAHELAELEVGVLQQRGAVDHQAEGVVVLAVLGDTLIGALRRISQEDRVRRWLVPESAPAREAVETGS